MLHERFGKLSAYPKWTVAGNNGLLQPEHEKRGMMANPELSQRIQALPEELLDLPAEELLTRLFHEETVRVFDEQRVTNNSPEDRVKVGNMLRSLGRLGKLEGNYQVYPGHEQPTNLDFERRFNPYMQQGMAQ